MQDKDLPRRKEKDFSTLVAMRGALDLFCSIYHLHMTVGCRAVISLYTVYLPPSDDHRMSYGHQPIHSASTTFRCYVQVYCSDHWWKRHFFSNLTIKGWHYPDIITNVSVRLIPSVLWRAVFKFWYAISISVKKIGHYYQYFWRVVTMVSIDLCRRAIVRVISVIP